MRRSLAAALLLLAVPGMAGAERRAAPEAEVPPAPGIAGKRPMGAYLQPLPVRVGHGRFAVLMPMAPRFEQRPAGTGTTLLWRSQLGAVRWTVVATPLAAGAREGRSLDDAFVALRNARLTEEGGQRRSDRAARFGEFAGRLVQFDSDTSESEAALLTAGGDLVWLQVTWPKGATRPEVGAFFRSFGPSDTPGELVLPTPSQPSPPSSDMPVPQPPSEPFPNPGPVAPPPRPTPPRGTQGLTFAVQGQQPDGQVTVGCDGTPKTSEANGRCEPYRGDTDCSQARPVLCMRGPVGEGRFELKATPPVVGREIRSIAWGNANCESFFGAGWKWAEFHGPNRRFGWAFTAFGELPKAQRFWVSIDDQQAHCFDH